MSACVSDNTEVDQESTITQRVSLCTDLLMSRERISWNIRHLRFLDEPMFCFSTLNANTNPNPNCRPGHRPWPLTPWQSLPGHRPWPLTRFIAVSSQGRCPGRLCIYLYFTRVDSNRMSTMTFSNARDFLKICMSVHNETVYKSPEPASISTGLLYRNG